MALSAQTLYNTYNPDGVVTTFAYSFCAFDEDDIKVYADDVLISASEYTVTGIGTRSGGNIVFTTAPVASIAELLIQLEPALVRVNDYQQNGELLSATLDDDMDKVYSLMQYLYQQYSRTLSFSDVTATDMVLAGDSTARASKLIGFDASGEPLLYAPADLTAVSIVTAFAETLLDDTNSAAARATLETVKNNREQEGIRYTTTGTAPNYSITPASPSVDSYVEGQRFTIEIHSTTTTGAPTLTITGLGGKTLYQYDGSGNKRAANLVAGQIAIVEYDGFDFIVLNPLPIYPLTSVRQTVQGGPVTSTGLPNFLPATDVNLTLTVQNVSTAYPLVVSASQGFGLNSDRIGVESVGTLTFTCTDAATNYLYVTVGTDGNLTAGTTTVQPVFQYGGTPATTAGLGTFDYATMTMYVGNGATAPAAWRVYVGEAVAAAGAITSTITYAYNGYYESAQYGLAFPSQYTSYHNIGAPSAIYTSLICTDAGGEGAYSQYDQIPLPSLHQDTGTQSRSRGGTSSLSVDNKRYTSSINSYVIAQSKTANSVINLTASKWKLKTIVKRVF